MIENNTNTVLAMDRIYFESPDSWEDELFDSTEYAMELDKRNPVLEGICSLLKVNSNDIKSIVKELNLRYRRMGVEEGVPKSVKNWLIGTPVNPAYRENLYNLCLALGMNLEETKVFFLKNYMTIPFNYKDRIDAIYYYGISHGMDYKSIKAFLDEFENLEEAGSYNDETALVGGYISEIDSIDRFREYLKQHTYGKNDQYNTAINEIKELLLVAARNAENERRLKPELVKAYEDEEANLHDENSLIRGNEKKNPVNIAGLLYVIYGYDNQDRYSSHKTKISKCEYLPKAFRENFPNDIEFSRIMSKEASPDVYRKALIILKFYNFFCHNLLMSIYDIEDINENTRRKKTLEEYWNRDPEDIEADLDDFYYETSKLLAKCGFVQMYARNPFDWLILYCSKSTDPLDTLRELLAQRYTDMDDE